MATPPMRLEQVGRKWRVVREDVAEKWSAVSPLMSRREAEWFLAQLQKPTGEEAIDEWVDIRIEAEKEDIEHKYAGHRPHKLKWFHKAVAEGRIKRAPYEPKMTKRRYERLLKRAAEEEKNR